MAKEQFDDLWSSLGLTNGHINYIQFVEKFEDPRTNGMATILNKAPSHQVYPIRGDDKVMTAEVAENELRAKMILNYGVSVS